MIQSTLLLFKKKHNADCFKISVTQYSTIQLSIMSTTH